MRKLTALILSALLIFILSFTMTVSAETIPNTIISNDGITVEFEDHTVYPGSIEEDSTASGDKYIKAGYGTMTPVAAEGITLTVVDSGYYDLETVMGYTSNTGSYSQVTVEIYNNGTKVIDYNNLSIGETVSGYKGNNGSTAVYKYNKGLIKLDEGTVIIKVIVGKCGNYYKFCLDYLKLTPTCSNAKDTVVEYEKFTQYPGSIEEDSTASGDKYIKAGYGTMTPVAAEGITLTVVDSGYYDLETVMGYTSSTDSYSQVTVEIYNNGTKVIDYNNLSIGETVSGYNGNNGSTAVYKYNKGPVWLDEGTVIIKVIVSKCGNYYKFCLDYLKFIPADSMTISEDSVTIAAKYEDAVTGKAILALYNGSELVSAETQTITNTNEIKISMKEKNSFDKAKLFIWNNVDDCVPLSSAKVFTK